MIREHITMHCDECGRALIVSPEAPEPLPPTLIEPGAAYATVFASHSAAQRAATARRWYVDAHTHLCVVCLAPDLVREMSEEERLEAARARVKARAEQLRGYPSQPLRYEISVYSDRLVVEGDPLPIAEFVAIGKFAEVLGFTHFGPNEPGARLVVVRKEDSE